MNIKKIAASFVAAAMTACSLVTGSFAADIGVADGTLDEKTGLLYVEKEDGTLRVTYPDKAEIEGDIVIPETFGEGENAKTVTEMDGSLIYAAERITSVSIPKTIKVLGDVRYYFSLGKLKSITVTEDNPSYSSVDGVLFNKDKTELLKYPAKKEGASYVVPSTITKIRDYGFSGSEISSIELPNGLKDLGTHAFWDCKNLKEVSLPGSLEYIGMALFDGAGVSSVTIDPSCSNYCVVDNVLFTSDKKTLVAYPLIFP